MRSSAPVWLCQTDYVPDGDLTMATSKSPGVEADNELYYIFWFSKCRASLQEMLRLTCGGLSLAPSWSDFLRLGARRHHRGDGNGPNRGGNTERHGYHHTGRDGTHEYVYDQ